MVFWSFWVLTIVFTYSHCDFLVVLSLRATAGFGDYGKDWIFNLLLWVIDLLRVWSAVVLSSYQFHISAGLFQMVAVLDSKYLGASSCLLNWSNYESWCDCFVFNEMKTSQVCLSYASYSIVSIGGLCRVHNFRPWICSLTLNYH